MPAEVEWIIKRNAADPTICPLQRGECTLVVLLTRNALVHNVAKRSRHKLGNSVCWRSPQFARPPL